MLVASGHSNLTSVPDYLTNFSYVVYFLKIIKEGSVSDDV